MTLFDPASSPTPEPGVVVAVKSLPSCDFCPERAHFDFATKMGPWANGCVSHYYEFRAASSLGTGKGQRLVKRP